MAEGYVDETGRIRWAEEHGLEELTLADPDRERDEDDEDEEDDEEAVPAIAVAALPEACAVAR